MCDCVPFALFPYSCNKSFKLQFIRYDWRPIIILGDSGFRLYRGISGPNGVDLCPLKLVNSVSAIRNRLDSRYGEDKDYTDLMFKEKEEKIFEFESGSGELELDRLSKQKDGVNTSSADGSIIAEDMNRNNGNDLENENMESVDLKLEELDQQNGNEGLRRRRRQTITRSSMFAKQVICIQSALNLGFVSQLWVDTNSWSVLIVEVKPNLLSSESERFLLEDVIRVGDVVLVQDEGVMEGAYRMTGLETLVGYNVITPTQRNIGKVRGYTFNINSGAVESLELDSFGISIIPSTLVSTYALLVEDIIDVHSDTVFVHEAAASRIQRLSKGLWGSQKVRTSIDELGEYNEDLEREPYEYDKDDQRTQTRTSRRKKSRRKKKDVEDDWELPMDYL